MDSSYSENKRLLEQTDDLQIKFNNKTTNLHCNHNSKSVKLLLEAGADPCTVDILGDTPLHCQYEEKAIKLLLEAGANPHAKNHYEFTPLHYPKTVGAINLLLEEGLHPFETNHYGEYPADNQISKKSRDFLQKITN
jgi:ankyrin repeat protein